MQEIVGKPEKKSKPKGGGGGNRKPGIIATVRELVENAGKKGISKSEILDALAEKFPERERDSMKSTVNVQVPNRINKEAFEVESVKDKDGVTRYKKA
jgi:hypothetical protein